MSNRYCLSLYLYLTHRVEDVLPLLTSFLTHSMICCQLRVRVRQQHHLTSRDFVWFITQVCPATSYNLLGPTQHHMPSEICKIPSMKVILIFVHLDHIFKVGKFVFHFDTENWEEQLTPCISWHKKFFVEYVRYNRPRFDQKKIWCPPLIAPLIK